MVHTVITHTSIDVHASLHASIGPSRSRPRRVPAASPPRGAGGAHRPSSLLAARPRPRETRARETRPRRDRDAFDRPRVGERERTRDANETRDAIESCSSLARGDDTTRNDDMSTKSGGGKGNSGNRGNRTTPFATMSVSPFLWCVETMGEETMGGGDDEGKARERDARER